MRVNRTNIIAMVLFWAVVAVWFPDEFRALMSKVLTYLGPMGFFLVPIATYLLIMTVMIVRYRHCYPVRHKELLLEHLEDFGEIAAVCGLLGTILAMITSSSSGTPDMSRFLESLYSTFVGSGISVLASTFRSIMTRPGMMPMTLRSIVKENSHAGKS